jgi:Bacterial regulatory helix-turn-helix protein, lysR family
MYNISGSALQGRPNARRRRLHLSDMRAVDAIAIQGSLLKVSAALNLTQPALSKTLHEAEDILQTSCPTGIRADVESDGMDSCEACRSATKPRRPASPERRSLVLRSYRRPRTFAQETKNI